MKAGGYCNVSEDTLVEEHDPAALQQMQDDFISGEKKKQRHLLVKSARFCMESEVQRQKELLQYRLFENDSDGDVIEGLGNTTYNIV